jgi:hypothetical protein
MLAYMKRLTAQKVDKSRALPLLNVVYTVFLGLLFRQTFQHQVDPITHRVVVTMLLTNNNILPVILLATYFLFDWLSANLTIELKDGVSHPLLLLLILLIVYLGATVMYAFAPSTIFYLCVFAYATVVAFWDLFVPHSNGDAETAWRGFVIGAVIAARSAIALTGLFWMVLLALLGFTGSVPEQLWPAALLLLFYVGLKVVRYVVYLGYEALL